jgi:hypothetical protein
LKMLLKYSFLFIYICAKPDFLCIIQLDMILQNIIKKQIWDSHCKSHTLKGFVKS